MTDPELNYAFFRLPHSFFGLPGKAACSLATKKTQEILLDHQIK